MIISARIITSPRKQRRCVACLSMIDGPALRMYGCAEEGDPKYAIYTHPVVQCAGFHPKVSDALDSMRKTPIHQGARDAGIR